MRPHTAQKHAGKAKCARALPKNTPGKQSASAHCPKTRRESKVRPHTARKHAVGSNGSTPTRQKHARKAKRTRALPKNTRGKQSAPAHCPETRRESKVRPHTARKHAGEAMGALPHCPETRRGDKMRPRTARKRAGKAKCVRTLPENTSGKQSAPAHCPETRRESKMRPHTARKHAGGSNGSTPTCQKRSMEGKMCLWFCLKRGWWTGRAWGVYGLAGKLVCVLGIVLKFVGLEGVRGALGFWKGVPCRVRGVLQSTWGMFFSCAGREAVSLVAKRSCASTFLGCQLQGFGRLDPKCGIRGICGVFCNGLCRCIEFSGPLAHGRLAYAVWAMPHKSCMVA